MVLALTLVHNRVGHYSPSLMYGVDLIGYKLLATVLWQEQSVHPCQSARGFSFTEEET